MTVFQFLTVCDNLKAVQRTGWLLRGVPPSTAEDVAAHSHTTAILAYLLALQAEEAVDLTQLLLMALIHDIPEAEIGDIPISAQRADPQTRIAKETAERKAMERILAFLPKFLRSPVEAAWTAYCNGKSIEARLVQGADRLATALHAAQLIKTGLSADAFQTFIDHAESTVTELQIPQANDFIEELRKVFTS